MVQEKNESTRRIPILLKFSSKGTDGKLCEALLRETFEILRTSGKKEFKDIEYSSVNEEENAAFIVSLPFKDHAKSSEEGSLHCNTTPVLLMLKDDKWDDCVAKMLYSANYEVYGIFRFSRLTDGRRDAEEFSCFAAAVKELTREYLRRNSEMHEQKFCKHITWKAVLSDSKNAGFISMFSDPSMRELARKFKDAVLDIRKRLPLKENTRIPSVMLLGETGCGKSQLAKALAEALFPGLESKYARFNISAYTEDLIDVELFGAWKGGFTDCTMDIEGIFAAHRGSVVFLDEIGDMNVACQTRLLTYMDDGNVVPRGRRSESNSDNKTQGSGKSNARVNNDRLEQRLKVSAPCILVAATNKPIDDEHKSDFRSDILHRFDHVIKIPPMRERKSDIRLMISLTLQDEEINPERQIAYISIDAIEYIEQLNFSGNFREFRYVLKQAVSRTRNSGAECLSLRHLVL